MNSKADIVFLNGTVITINEQDQICQAVAIKKNRIIGVGSSTEMRSFIGSKTQIFDLKGRSLLPGFNDAHCHAGNYGPVKSNIMCQPEKVPSIQVLKEEIKKRAQKIPKGEWILGRGYDHTQLKEKRHPNRWDLDEAAPQHKVFILRTCGHLGVINSLALKEFGISKETADPPGGKIERNSEGEPTGLLYEQALVPIRMRTQPNYNDLIKGLKIMNDDFLSYGITSVTDASGRNPDEIRAFQEGINEGWLKVRICFQVRISPPIIDLGNHYIESGLLTGFGNERLRLGALKLMLDGAGSGGSAAMREAYPGRPKDFGILHMGQEELDNLVLKGHKAGYQVGVHAIGDRAIEMTIESFEKALNKFPRDNCRHRIEHCGFLDKILISKIRKIKLLPILGLPFLYELGGSYISVYGLERLQNVYPLNSLMKEGIISPLSSDAPVIDPNPLKGIYFAVTRRSLSGDIIGPQEAVSVLDAIRAYTLYGAYSTFEENVKGSIKIGKYADLIILSDDILKTPPQEIRHLGIDLTMVNGEIVYLKNSNF